MDPKQALGTIVGRGKRAVRDGLRATGANLETVTRDLAGLRPEDPLSERDPDYISKTLPANKRLTDLYFRSEVRGLEHVPAEGPALLVGNHSGGTLIADTYAFSFAFYEHFGSDRPFFQLAHDLAVSVPGLSAMLRRYGTMAANHENAGRALEAGAAVLVYPGGDHETFRESWRSDEVDFGGRSGFVRLALAYDVPIIPVVALGGQETALFVTRGERLARLLKLDRLRIKVLPVQLAPPVGVTVLDLPGRVPLPAEITIQVLPPIDLRKRLGQDPDEEAAYEAVVRDMQIALDALSEERDLPLVGTFGRRDPERTPTMRGLGDREPWPGYDEMTVPEVRERLRAEGSSGELAAAVRSYEEAHKRRKGVIEAAEQAA